MRLVQRFMNEFAHITVHTRSNPRSLSSAAGEGGVPVRIRTFTLGEN